MRSRVCFVNQTTMAAIVQSPPLEVQHMKSVVLGMALCCGLLYIGPQQAKADQWDKRTIMTFSGPIEIPGQVLPAGKYVFKLMDSPADRHIVQVYNDKETHLITTLVA